MSNPIHGLSHIALKVADLDRAVRFYETVFGVQQYVRGPTAAQVLGPGAADVIAFELLPEGAAQPGGIMHFGFRLTGPDRLDEVLERVVSAGGSIESRGDFGNNQPYAFIRDPDGYQIEIWHEHTPLHLQP